MKTSEVTGIVLRQFPIFEKDKCIELYSETHGKLKLLTKHAQKRFGGKVDPLNVLRCQLYKGQSFEIVTQCDLVTHFARIRTSLEKINAALHVSDIMRHITPYHHPNPELYRHLLTCLETINNTTESCEKIIENFQKNIMTSEGLLTEHENCSDTIKQTIESYAQKRISPITTRTGATTS